MITLTPCPAGATPLRPAPLISPYPTRAAPGPAGRTVLAEQAPDLREALEHAKDIARAAPLVLTHFEHGYIT